MIIAGGCVPPCHEHEIAFELLQRWENQPRALESSGRGAAAAPPASRGRNDPGTPTGGKGRFKPIQGESRQLKVKSYFVKNINRPRHQNPMNAPVCHELRLPSSSAGQTQSNLWSNQSTSSQNWRNCLILRELRAKAPSAGQTQSK